MDNLSELYACECEENSHKNIKIKLKDIGHNTLIRTSCESCRSKKDQPLSTLIERFPSTFKLCKKNMEKFILLLKKCVYPYEYMDSFDKFDETTLPNIENFYSSLELRNFDVKEYNHAKKLWGIFNIKNIGDYHDLYVQADTAQLSDVFENFRSLCLREYQLDPGYYVSTPSLTFDAMLKITGAKIELFTDIDMVLMTEKGIRGGLTQAIKKYAVANNKYLDNYDKTKDSIYLQYLDANKKI